MGRRSDHDLADRVTSAILTPIIFAISFVIGFVAGKVFRIASKAVTPYGGDISQRPPFPVSTDKPVVPFPAHVRFLFKLAMGAALLLVLVGSVLILDSSQVPPSQRSATAGSISLLGVVLIIATACTAFVISGRSDQTEIAQPEAAPAEESEPTGMLYTLALPPTTEWDMAHALQFINQLLNTFGILVFQIAADAHGIVWQVVDTKATIAPNLLEQAIRSHFPTVDVTITQQSLESMSDPFYRYVCYYRQSNLFLAPLNAIDSIKAVDPLIALTQVMSSLQAGERVIFMVGVADIAQDAYKEGERLISYSTINPLQYFTREGIEDALHKKRTGQDKADRFESRDQQVLEDKLRQKLYSATVMVQVDSPYPERLSELLILVDAQIAHFTRMPYNSLDVTNRPLDQYMTLVKSPQRAHTTNALGVYERWLTGQGEQRPPRLILEPREIAALWHLPYAGFNAPRILWGSKLIGLPEAVAANREGIVLGAGRYQGKRMNVRLPQADRVSHINILGRTGTGKSSLLHTLIHQDIAQGYGVAVVDPHGALVRDVLRYSIPREREADTIVLDLTDTGYPPPLNPLGGIAGYSQMAQIISIIERLFDGTTQAARMSSYLRAALLLLQNQDQATMRDVVRVFMDEAYRETLLNGLDDPETQDFWDYQFNTSSPQMQRQIAEPIINRIRPFFANRLLYPILCHPDTIDFRSLMRQKKIILISLGFDDEQVPQQEQELIGALLVSRLQMAGMKDQTEQPYYIYIDEVQKFVTTSFSDMLTGARKFGLSLVTANQYLGQLTGKTLEAVMGNVGTTLVLQCSPEDTSALSGYMKPEVNAQDLLNLDKFQAAVKMQIASHTQPAFMLETLPPVAAWSDIPPEIREQTAQQRERQMRQQSIQTYTPKSRDAILSWLKDRYPRRPRAQTSSAVGDEESFYE